MKRRAFIAGIGSAVALPLTSHAQERTRRVGALILGNADAEAFGKELRQGLASAGYVEGRNLQVDIRSAQGRLELLPQLAAELVATRVDVLFALYTPCARAAQQATRDIPIVSILANPVETGFIASLSRPGGNFTGVSMLAAEAHGKCVEVWADMLPGIRKVAALINTRDPFTPLLLEKIELSGKEAGVEIVTARAGGLDELEPAITAAQAAGAQALVMQGSLSSRAVSELSLKHRLPAASFTRSFSEVGGLFSYGPDATDAFQRGTSFVIRVLQGGKPADMPVEQATKFELVINMKTAKVLNVSVPPMLLARADEVIE